MKTPEEKRLAHNEYERRRLARRTPEQVEQDRERQAANAQKYYRRHREKILAALKADPKYREKRRLATAVYRNRVLRAANNYHQKLASQNGVCFLCGKPFDANIPSLKPHYDHNHTTGQWRDFLHMKCNTAIGLLCDSPELCIKAAEYLRRHENQ
jgi:hypothetical protein